VAAARSGQWSIRRVGAVYSYQVGTIRRISGNDASWQISCQAPSVNAP
jgi:hypothetical protein